MGGSSSQVCWRQPWNASSESLLREALQSIGAPVEDLASQVRDPSTSTIGGIRDYKLATIGSAGLEWSSILLHLGSLLGEPLAEQLSRLQEAPVLCFIEFDQATWGYSLYHTGQRLDYFWSDPAYVDLAPDECAGQSVVLAEACGVAPDIVAPYLRKAEGISPNEKAFPDDEFLLQDHWVRVDLMRRLGIEYPDPGDQLHVLVNELGVASDNHNVQSTTPTPSAAAKKKPWWRVW